MATFQSFPDVDSMLSYLQDQQRVAREYAEQHAAWLDSFEVGSCYINCDNECGVLIYGEIIESEYEEDRVACARARKDGYLLARAASVYCPHSELGNVHVSTMGFRISREAFEALREANWPASPQEAAGVLNLYPGGILGVRPA